MDQRLTFFERLKYYLIPAFRCPGGAGGTWLRGRWIRRRPLEPDPGNAGVGKGCKPMETLELGKLEVQALTPSVFQGYSYPCRHATVFSGLKRMAWKRLK
jgi:hypothetical protein